jgi:hypothetical protein
VTVAMQWFGKHFSTIEAVFCGVRAEELFWRRLTLQGSHPCGGGFEYLHHDPASRRRRRQGKSQIW